MNQELETRRIRAEQIRAEIDRNAKEQQALQNASSGSQTLSPAAPGAHGGHGVQDANPAGGQAQGDQSPVPSTGLRLCAETATE